MQPLDYFDLIEMFPKPGCAVCNLLLHDVHRYLDGLLYEFALDPDIQKAFRLGRGLCNEHSWELGCVRGGYSLSIAVLYRTAVGEVLKIMEETPATDVSQTLWERLSSGNSHHPGSVLAECLEPDGICIVCEHLAHAEQRYTDTLSKCVNDPRLRGAYVNSDGLCLPHFRRTLRQTKNPANLQQLVSIQKAIWDRLQVDLDEFIAKNDYRRMHEPRGPESSSWSRAPRRMAGERGVFGLESRSA